MPGLSEPQTASLAKGHMSELYKEAGCDGEEPETALHCIVLQVTLWEWPVVQGDVIISSPRMLAL